MAIDYDRVDDWHAALSTTITACHKRVISNLRDARPESVHEALQRLLDLPQAARIIATATNWVQDATVLTYHGTRLTDEETASVRRQGLMPLKAASRRRRIERALGRHPRWPIVESHLPHAIRRIEMGCAGNREHQVHLTLSRNGLLSGFNHYLTHGAEVDKHIAFELLGDEGVDLLRQDGRARILRIAVPGAEALKAANRYGPIEHHRGPVQAPNLIREFLQVWSLKCFNRNFQSDSLRTDCGLVFDSLVPKEWISYVETPETRTLLPVREPA